MLFCSQLLITIFYKYFSKRSGQIHYRNFSFLQNVADPSGASPYLSFCLPSIPSMLRLGSKSWAKRRRSTSWRHTISALYPGIKSRHIIMTVDLLIWVGISAQKLKVFNRPLHMKEHATNKRGEWPMSLLIAHTVKYDSQHYVMIEGFCF